MRFIYAILVIIFMTIILACSEEEKDNRSMEQIYREEGVPVTTRKIMPQMFMVQRSYNAVLTGLEQSSAYAKVGDKVEKVFVKVGEYVKKDQILLTFPINNPKAQYFQAKIGYENAKLAYERIANMYQTGGISKQQLDNARANYDVAAANWDAAQQTVIVKAPISGFVTKVNIRESDNVKKEAELFTISRMDRMKARVWITEKDASEVVIGLPAYAIWNGAKIEGTIVEVDMALNQKKQAFGAVVEFDNPKTILKFGITVEVFIRTYSNPGALVLQAKVLLREGDEYYVYKVVDGTAIKTPVKTGNRFKMFIEIVDGLTVGDEVVISGQMLLQPDTKIKVVN